MSDIPTRASPSVEVVLGLHALRVRINGLMHLHVAREKIVSFQGWAIGRPACGWSVEFTMSEGPNVLAEYDRADIWEAILNGVEEKLHG